MTELNFGVKVIYEAGKNPILYLSYNRFASEWDYWRGHPFICPTCRKQYEAGYDNIDAYCENCVYFQNYQKDPQKFRNACKKRFGKLAMPVIYKRCKNCEEIRLGVHVSIVKKNKNTKKKYKKPSKLTRLERRKAKRIEQNKKLVKKAVSIELSRKSKLKKEKELCKRKKKLKLFRIPLWRRNRVSCV